MIQASKREVWNFNLDQKLFIEVSLHGIIRENSNFEPRNDGKGCWCYYITVPERVIGTELFEREFWLEDIPKKFTEASPIRITHDYYKASFNDVNWHCGVTFYEKNGHTVGHRSVKIGCDFSHLYDEEHGYPYDFNSVALEAMETAKQLKEKYKL